MTILKNIAALDAMLETHPSVYEAFHYTVAPCGAAAVVDVDIGLVFKVAGASEEEMKGRGFAALRECPWFDASEIACIHREIAA